MSLNYKKYSSKILNSNTTFLVVHGWGTSLNHIEPLSEALSSMGDVYAIDLPGHGASFVPNEVWGMVEFADSVCTFIKQLGIKKVIYVGHSFGGKTGIMLASREPSLIDKLVLIGASGLRPRQGYRKKLKFLFLKLLRNLIRFRNTKIGKKIYEEWYIPKFASRDYKNAGPMLRTFVKTVNEELEGELKRITCPSLLIWGSEDEESPLSVAERMRDLLKNSKLIVLPEEGHFPYIGGGLGLIVRYIREFIKGI